MGAPKLARVAPWVGAIVLGGAGVVAMARLPKPLVANPQCRTLAPCEEACAAGKPWACSELAALYDDGKGVAKNPPKAAQLWSEACDAGNGNACFQMASMFERGTHGHDEDPAQRAAYQERMFRAYARECDEGLAGSCFGLANCYEEGTGTIADAAKAASIYDVVRAFWQKRCDDGAAQQCAELGLLYAHGISVPEDAARGLTLLERACELGRAGACSLAGFRAKAAMDLDNARKLLTRACELEHESACDSAAELTRDTEEKVAIYRRRAELYGALCERDHVEACWTAANTLVDKASYLPRDEDKARGYKQREVKLRQTGCEQGSAEDCASLAITLEMGQLVDRDIMRAVALLARACELGDASACASKREALGDVVDMSLGYHTCVVKTDGSVWCWGQNRDGQLGDGTKEDRDHPVRAQGIDGAVNVDLYGGTTCVLTADKAASCWGAGFEGVQRVGGDEPATAIAAGFDLACVLRAGGKVSCAGYDPRELDIGATAIRVGGLQRCAIAKGELLCWGSVMQDFVAEPTAVLPNKNVVDASVSSEGFCALFEGGDTLCRAQPLASEPMREVKLSGVRLISGDADAGCAMKGDELWCWYLREGQLKEPFLVKKLPGVKKLVVRSYEGCALTDNKDLLCWYVFNPDPEPVTFQQGPSPQ